MRSSDSGRRGMSLVEVTIVVVILGVIMAAVFMMFVSGTEHFNFARRQNELDVAGRLALDRLTNEVIWVGYMPYGGWDNDDWHPVTQADNDSLGFYADFRPFRTLDDADYRHVMLLNNRITVTDNAGKTQQFGENVTDLSFLYFDEDGDELVMPLDEAGRDLIRHVQITIELTATYAGDVYQTVLHTTVSPRNLGVNHNINPAFFPPAPLDGIIVFNVDGIGAIPEPTEDQQLMINRLQLWGYTVTVLTDDQLITYDYTDVMVIVLRHMDSGSHSGMASFLEGAGVPIVTLDAQDAYECFGMGTGEHDSQEPVVTAYAIDHPVFKNITPDTIYAYSPISSGRQSMLLGTDPALSNPEYLGIGGTAVANCAIIVRDEDDEALRRIHFSPYDASEYTESGGWPLFYNAIAWSCGTTAGDHGDELTTLEDFEGPGVSSQEINLWEENVNPTAVTDTTVLFWEPFTDAPLLSWSFAALGMGSCGINTTDDVLQMHRPTAGTGTRNIATVTVDLSPFSYMTDELLLSVKCRSYEGAPDAMDGVFFTDIDTLFHTGFPTAGVLPPGITTQIPVNGQWRVHSPAGWLGDGNFITLDRVSNGAGVANRMAVYFSTGGLPNNTPLTVSYRFHDHNDGDNTGATGDFVGWSSVGIAAAPTDPVNLTPSSYNNSSWFNRSYRFTPVTMPANLYVLFGSNNNNTAVSLDNNDGISLDNIVVTADTTYTRIGAGAGPAGWETVFVDLDDAAFASSYPFGSNYRVSLSQFGGNPIPSGGMQWDDLRISRLTPGLGLSGWSHGPMSAGHLDTWNTKEVDALYGYSWTVQQASGTQYANNTYCYLTTPTVSIPAWVVSPKMQFTHYVDTQNQYDGGFVQLSVDGGGWVTLTDASGLVYSANSLAGFPGGAGMRIFCGLQTWRTDTVNLDSYAGHTVRFRFVFGSNTTTADVGWHIDNFRVFGQATGYEISALDFEAASVPSPWNFTYDVYMAAIADSTFAGAGEIDKATMTQVVDEGTLGVNSTGWKTLNLDDTFLLPPGMNLCIKVEQHDAGWTSANTSWMTEDAPSAVRCRQAGSDTADPTVLALHARRPAIRVQSTTGALGEISGTTPDDSVPLNNYNLYNDFEVIYLASELGTSGSGGWWTHGGRDDDWEIAAPLVLSVDPALTPENGLTVAGTDLTVDGYYPSNQWAWLVSPAYTMPSQSLYDSVSVEYYRCVRLSATDDAYISIGFSNSTTPPDSVSSAWKLVRQYSGENQLDWDDEWIDLTPEFTAAWGAGYSYYFIRFLQYSGPFMERGGWNLDNIQFFAVPN